MPVVVPPLAPAPPQPLPRFEGHGCIACGTDNPHSLGMRFFLEEGGTVVRSPITLDAHRMGWVGVAHGGVVSTVLDEIMAWAVLSIRRTLFLTRRLEVDFKRPARLGVPLVARGGLLDEPHDKGVWAWGTLEDADGKILARSRGDMVQVPPLAIGATDPDTRRQVEELLAAMEERVG